MNNFEQIKNTGAEGVIFDIFWYLVE